jgi:hypothetical protein
MATRNNSTPPARNGQTLFILPPLKRHPQTFTSPGAIRYRVRFLRATYGDCLNTWPDYAKTEYEQLTRRLRELESDRG